MMQERKRKKAAQLFLAMGQIDDALLQEAMLYRPRRRSSALSRVILLAATLSTLAVVLVAGVIVAMRANKDLVTPPTVNDPSLESPNGSVEEDQAALALDALLLGKTYNNAGAPFFTAVEEESDLPFFSGNAHIIWEKDGVYYVSRVLTQREIKALTGELGKGERVGEQSPTLSCRVWILLPDGTVLSPYLESSFGNTANGSLFDYQAELIPSDALISCISGILN